MRSFLFFCLLITVFLFTGLAKAQQPKKMFRIALLTRAARSAALVLLHRSIEACANWATSRARTSLLSAGMRVDRWTAFRNSPPTSPANLWT